MRLLPGISLNALIKNHNIFQRQGTQWAKVYNLIETVFFLNSRDSPGIQLADLAPMPSIGW